MREEKTAEGHEKVNDDILGKLYHAIPFPLF